MMSSSSYQKITPQTQSIHPSTSYLHVHDEDQEFKKVQKHLETLALRESIKRKSMRNHSHLNHHHINLSDLKSLFIKSNKTPFIRNLNEFDDQHSIHSNNFIQSPISMESKVNQKSNSLLEIDFSHQDILMRSERVQSAFIEHCQWTHHPSSSSSNKVKNHSSLLTKVTEERHELDFKVDESNLNHPSSIDTIIPNPLFKSNSKIIQFHPKSTQYLSTHSFDTLVSNSNQSSSSTEFKSFHQPPLLKPQMKFKQHEKSSYQLDHEFNRLNEFDEFDDHPLYPSLNCNHSASSHSIHQIRNISFLDWILCSCCISNEDLNDPFDLQIGKTCPG